MARPRQLQPAFDVASVRPSQRAVGPDYNNQFTYSPNGIVARNATLKRLLAEAWRLQVNQIVGPEWLDRNEYDIQANSATASSSEQKSLMLRSLLAERFNLNTHSETREMRAYELTIGKSGPKIQPMRTEEQGSAASRISFSRGSAPIRRFAGRSVVDSRSNEPE